MDIESIERRWRQEAGVRPAPLEEGPVLQMIETRAAALRRSLRGRLRREAGYYLPMIAVSLATLLSGFTMGRVGAACAVLVLLGGVIVTLWRAERRIAEAPLDGSVEEALTRLLSELDAAGRAYVAVYVGLFVVAGASLTGAVWWRDGVGPLFAGALAGTVLAVVWSRRSGRRYVERMFRRHRTELVDCLRQIEGQA